VLAPGTAVVMRCRLTYDLSGTLDALTLTDQSVGTEEHDTDLAGLEVHAHAGDTGREPVCSSVLCPK
jgi:hypothetical protein